MAKRDTCFFYRRREEHAFFDVYAKPTKHKAEAIDN